MVPRALLRLQQLGRAETCSCAVGNPLSTSPQTPFGGHGAVSSPPSTRSCAPTAPPSSPAFPSCSPSSPRSLAPLAFHDQPGHAPSRPVLRAAVPGWVPRRWAHTQAQTVQEPPAAQARAGSPALRDRFGRFHNYLRISLTERCNLRCQYCMPEDGIRLTPHEDLLTTDEIMALSTLFVRSGVTKIRFTGGEPSIRRDLVDIIRHTNDLRPLGLTDISMTTNGIALKRKLNPLVDAGLNGVNISLDTLDPFKFELITRRKGFERVLDCIKSSVDVGLRVKVNCVVMRAVNFAELLDFVALTKDLDVEVRFIEYMPFDGNKWAESKLVTYNEMVETIQAVYPGGFRRLDDEENATAKTWKVQGFKGRVGFITSMTNNFCSTCNRIRITADGNLKVCLFGNEEVSLRDVLRANGSMSDMEDVIAKAVQGKAARHAGMTALAMSENRPMITIGG